MVIAGCDGRLKVVDTFSYNMVLSSTNRLVYRRFWDTGWASRFVLHTFSSNSGDLLFFSGAGKDPTG
uniref:Uncharacterized protein n=1 Tax=Oryza meridionalis TaxID=40149 RepID=A0A0E0E380_9ORYZ